MTGGKPQTLGKLHLKFRPGITTGSLLATGNHNFYYKFTHSATLSSKFFTPSLFWNPKTSSSSSISRDYFISYCTEIIEASEENFPRLTPSLVPSNQHHLPDIQLSCLLPWWTIWMVYKASLCTWGIQPLSSNQGYCSSNFPMSLPYYWPSSLLDHS